MRKNYSKLLISLVCVVMVFLFSFTANAASELKETVDGIEYTYTVTDSKASITNINYKGFSEFHIPETLGGYEVTFLDRGFMSKVSYNEALGEEIPVTVYIPKTITSMDSSALFDNYAEKFIVDGENPSYSSDEQGVLYSKDKTILYRIPQFSKIEKYDIPDGVTTIASYACNACNSLKKITFPNTLKAVGSQAFTYTQNIKKIELPDSVSYLSSNAFIYCVGLEELKISASLETIENSAFSECYSLKKVIIPEGVKKINRYAFENDQMLEEVYLPASLTEIEIGVFGNCLPLKDICYAGSEEDWKNVIVDTNSYDDYRETIVDKVNVHYNVPVNTYENVDYEYQNDVLVISGTGAIPALSQGGWSYAKENYAASATGVIIGGDIDSIGSYFFEGFTQLSHVVISSPAVNIEPNAFNNCSALRNVILFGDSNFTDTAFTNSNSDINVFQPLNGAHTFNESTEQIKAVKYSYSDGILSFNGNVHLSAYEFLDNISAFCLIYDNISSVQFSSLVFDDMQLYYLDEDFNLKEVEGNYLENCNIYPALTENPDDAITFNELTASVADGTIDQFCLITTAENQTDISVPQFQVVQDIIDFIEKALRWVVTLMDKLFALLNRFFK